MLTSGGGVGIVRGMNTKDIYDMNQDDLAEVLVGQVVESIDTEAKTLTLCNGTVLEFQDDSACCAYWEAELVAGNLTNNAVTSVVRVDGEDQDYRIHIIAADDRIATLNIDGDEGNGYYIQGIALEVRVKK